VNRSALEVERVVSKFKAVLEVLGVLAETKVGLLRLARELKKTVRRVNALEKQLIPENEAAVKWIESVLEESERESFITLKMVKARLESRRGGGG
jgi:V/A-type H+-transporting ATPase subunit D